MAGTEEIKRKIPIKREREKNVDYKYIENQLREILGTKVNITNKKMDIFFSSSDDLNRILEIMNIDIDGN